MLAADEDSLDDLWAHKLLKPDPVEPIVLVPLNNHFPLRQGFLELDFANAQCMVDFRFKCDLSNETLPFPTNLSIIVGSCSWLNDMPQGRERAPATGLRDR